MTRYVPLDSGIVGLLCLSPGHPKGTPCQTWLAQLALNGTVVVLPDLIVHEVRRERLRLGVTAQLARLDQLRRDLGPTPVTPEAWLKAAEFRAIVRQAGRPTASPDAIDADAILAGVAASIGSAGDSVTVATTNVRHLSWFPGVDARKWETIS